MRFLQPQNLFWALLLVVPVLLYLFRLKPRTVSVSTLNFFKTLAQAHRESPWVRWLKRLLSFLLSALVLVGVVGALSGPVVSPSSEQLKRVVILVDRSASMAASAKDESTNLEHGIQNALTRLSGLPGGVEVMVLAYDRRPKLILSNTLERRRVRRALDRIDARPMEGNPDRALNLARRLAATSTPAAIWHVTDQPNSARPTDKQEDATKTDSSPDDVNTVRIPAGNGDPVNAGITAFRIRQKPMDPEQLQLFIEVQNALSEPREAELDIRFDGELSEVRTLSLKPGEHERLLLPLRPGTGRVAEADLSMNGDRLSLDNTARAFLPESDPIQVFWIHPDERPFTRMALLTMTSNNTITLHEGDASSWPPETPDGNRPVVFVFDSWLPDEWPDQHPAIVLNPPSSTGPLRAKSFDDGAVPVRNVRRVKPYHPISFGVSEGRLVLHQTSVIRSDGPLNPIWTGPAGTLLAAGTVNGQRITVMPFSPESSGRFPLTVSFPLLLSNTIYWSAKANQTEGKRPPGNASIHDAGEVVKLSGSPLHWLDLNRSSDDGDSSDGSNLFQKVDETVPSGPWIDLDRTGLWRTEAGERGASLLLSGKETRLSTDVETVEDQAKSASSGGEQAVYETSLIRGDITTMILWIVLALLLSESWLRNRWAVY